MTWYEIVSPVYVQRKGASVRELIHASWGNPVKVEVEDDDALPPPAVTCDAPVLFGAPCVSDVVVTVDDSIPGHAKVAASWTTDKLATSWLLFRLQGETDWIDARKQLPEGYSAHQKTHRVTLPRLLEPGIYEFQIYAEGGSEGPAVEPPYSYTELDTFEVEEE
jgi:hypothetical protein